jgi:hypothetical protein
MPPDPSVDDKRGRETATCYGVEFIGDREEAGGGMRGVAPTVLVGGRAREGWVAPRLTYNA